MVEKIIKSMDMEYTNIYHSPGIEPWICQVLKNYPSSTDLMLDVGCGLGFWGKLIRNYLEPMSFIIGIDIAIEKLKIVKSLGIYDVLICADCSHLPFKEDSLNGMISIEVLHGLPNFEKILKSMLEILKNRGLIILSQPSTKYHIKILQKLDFDILGNIARGLFLVRIRDGEVIIARKSFRSKLVYIFLTIGYKIFSLNLINYIIAIRVKDR